MFLEDVIGEMRRRSPPCAAWCTTGTPRARGRLEEAMALLKKQEVLCLELGNRSGLAYCYWYWGLLNPHDTCEELCRDPKHCPSRECERQEESAHNTNISKPLGWRIFASHWVVLLLLATEKGPSPASS